MATIYKRKGLKSYYISYTNHLGKRVTVRGCPDKETTMAIAHKLESKVLLRAHGVIDAQSERLAEAGQKTIDEHLAEFVLSMEAEKRTAKHIRGTKSYIMAVNEACRFEYTTDLDGAKVSAHKADLIRDGRGARAINARLTAFKSFTRWLWKNGRIQSDPMAAMNKLNVKTDRRYWRRALTEDEIDRLIEAAEQGPIVSKMTGPERALLYHTALGTGLRAGELASLTTNSFNLDDLNNATVSVKASYSKHRDDDILPIRRDLAEMIAEHIAHRKPRAKVFRIPDKTAKMLKVDLKAAEIPHTDDSGDVIDFHALRHTFITRLVLSGANPAVVMKLARHSTITLTMDFYTHLYRETERDALNKLPGIGAKVQRQLQRANASNSKNVRKRAQGAKSNKGKKTAITV